MRCLVLLVAAVAAVASPVSVASSRALSGGERRPALEHELLREINRVRAARSLPRLEPAAGLHRAATEHSRALLEAGIFDHRSPDGTTFEQRVLRYYPNSGWRSWSIGETLLATSERLDAQLIVAKWLESRTHRTIVLSPTWREVGIGAHFAPAAPGQFGGAPTTVVTADFGARQGKLSQSRG